MYIPHGLNFNSPRGPMSWGVGCDERGDYSGKRWLVN